MNEEHEVNEDLLDSIFGESAAVSGLDIELNTNKAVAGASVFGGGRGTYTDGYGRYTLGVKEPGLISISFGAPSREMHGMIVGEVLEQREVEIATGQIARVDVAIDLCGTSDPPYERVVDEFTGEFKIGHERCLFHPEGGVFEDAKGLKRNVAGAWVEFSRKEDRSLFGWGSYKVRWRGALAGPGGFGHMFCGDYLMVVEQVLTADPAQ